MFIANWASSATANELGEIFYTPIGEDRSVKEKLEEACSKAEQVVNRNQPLQLCGSHHPDSGGFCGGQAVPACHGRLAWPSCTANGTLKQLFEPQHDADNPRLLISCLGGGSAAEYEENELVLQKGDLIVLCTDGICCQGRLKWLLRLSVSASTIAKLSTMGKYSDNATILLAKVEEL